MIYKDFINFSWSQVRKSELPEMTSIMLAIVEKHDPVALKITGMYSNLSELRPLLDILAVKYDGNPNSPVFDEQRRLRNTMLSAINSHIAGKEKAGEVISNQDAALAIPYINRYLKGIYTEPNLVKSGRVNQMLNGLNDNDEMNNAIAALGLSDYMDRLRAYQENVNKGETHRTGAMSVRPKYNNSNADKRVISAIDNLLRAIELGKAENLNLDYQALINELNVFLTNRLAIIKSRSSRGKNSENQNKATDAPSPTTDASAS